MTESEPAPLADLVVNDRFWLSLARTQLERTLDTRHRASSMLLTGVSWFSTVYTGSVLLSVSRADFVLDTWRAIVLAFPVVVLSAAYLFGLWASQPIMSTFDPRDPAAIEEAFERAVRTSAFRLRIASGCLVAGVLAVAVAVAVFAGGAGPSTT